MRRRLNSRCEGLLEVGPAASLDSEALYAGDVSLIQQPMSDRKSLADFTVQYLHRSVREFLETPRVWDRIMLAGPHSYNPYLALCRSFIAQLKCLDPGSSSSRAFSRAVGACMFYARRAQDQLEEGQSAQSLVSLIDDIDHTATNFHKVSTEEPSWLSRFSVALRSESDVKSGLTISSLAVRLGLHTYVEAKLHHGCLAHVNDGVMPLLRAAIEPIGPSDLSHSKTNLFYSVSFPNVKMVKMLLEHGADPNMVCLYKERHRYVPRTQTVFQTLLGDIRTDASISVDTGDGWADVIYLFLMYGADTTVDLGDFNRTMLRYNLSDDKYNRVLAIMKVGRRRTWFTQKKEKNPNLDASGHLKNSGFIKRGMRVSQKEVKWGE